MVDEAWVKNTVENAAKFGISAESALTPKIWGASTEAAAAPVAPANDVPFESAPAAPAAAAPVAAPVAPAMDPALLATIKTLIVNKGLLTDEATDDAVQAKVVEIAGEPLTGANGPQIINTIATHVV